MFYKSNDFLDQLSPNIFVHGTLWGLKCTYGTQNVSGIVNIAKYVI
jgi:hypothetical protein